MPYEKGNFASVFTAAAADPMTITTCPVILGEDISGYVTNRHTSISPYHNVKHEYYSQELSRVHLMHKKNGFPNEISTSHSLPTTKPIKYSLLNNCF